VNNWKLVIFMLNLPIIHAHLVVSIFSTKAWRRTFQEKSRQFGITFDLAEDTKYALCKTCGKSISHGGDSTKVYNTSNLVNHLKCHSKVYEEYQPKHTEYLEKEKAKKEEGSAKQLSLFVVQDKVKAWDINDSRAQRVHRFVMEMIAVDNQPFSLVEDFGFARLLHMLELRYHLPSRKYFVKKLLPLVHDEVKTRVKAEIGSVTFQFYYRCLEF